MTLPLVRLQRLRQPLQTLTTPSIPLPKRLPKVSRRKSVFDVLPTFVAVNDVFTPQSALTLVARPLMAKPLGISVTLLNSRR